MVPQLDKCLNFKSIRGDNNDCTLCRITPRNATNFGHLSSCGTIEPGFPHFFISILPGLFKVKIKIFQDYCRGKKCWRGLYDRLLISSRKILNDNFACIFKNFWDFSGTFSSFSFFQGLEIYFSFSRFSRFSRCVGALRTVIRLPRH